MTLHNHLQDAQHTGRAALSYHLLLKKLEQIKSVY